MLASASEPFPTVRRCLDIPRLAGLTVEHAARFSEICRADFTRMPSVTDIHRTIATYLLLVTCTWFVGAQSPGQRGAVQLSAQVQDLPPAITLEWPIHPGATGYSVYRRVLGASAWGGSIATLGGGSTGYIDNAVQVGVSYEYKVRRTGNGVGYGHLCSGVMVEASDAHYRGKMILMVEEALEQQIDSELEVLELDLLADGWWPLRYSVAATASVSSVRDTIIAAFNADPVNVRSVFIVGHVPVPYSGNLAPDGHSQHLGAWAADGFYGDVDGNWTDNTVNSIGALTYWNHNVPGDGKFDQSDFPSDIELQVGRVFLGKLPEFGVSEAQLTIDYLNKVHDYKHKVWEPDPSAIVYDNLEWVGNPLSASGYQSFSACVGAGNVFKADAATSLWSDYYEDDHLFGYHSGSGIQSSFGTEVTFVGVGNGGRTDALAVIDHGCAFNMSFGSYFGDWDNYNNYLRAMLASGNGLTSVWSGSPNWFFHHMAMGSPIGYSAFASMNNTNANYSLQNGGWQGQGYSRVHMGLMGDPSLRLKMVSPPSDLVVTNSGYFTAFSWSPSNEVVDGYYLYRIDSLAGEIERISPLISGTTHIDSTIVYQMGERYMVRAAAMTTSASGSYENLSLGAMAYTTAIPLADCEGVIGGMAIPGTPCDDADTTTVNDTWSTVCICEGAPVGIMEHRQLEWQAFPNPASTEWTLVLPAEFNGILNLYDSSGRIILSSRLGGGVNVVDVNQLVQGIYHAHVHGDDHLMSARPTLVIVR